MNNLKKVSIITVAHNIIQNKRKKYFKQMFDSIHNQTYQNIEHIIIDGASDDGSVEYFKEVARNAKKEIKIFSEPDSGIYNAMNKGIKKASGEYIAFMNTDDYYSNNNAIEALVEKFIKPEISFACGNAKIIYSNKKVKDFKAKINSAFYRMPFCHQTMLCKKSLFDKYGLFNESFKIAADYDFILKIISNWEKGAKITDKNLVHFRYMGISLLKREETNKEATIILHKYYNSKLLSVKDCENIFYSRLSFITIIKLFMHISFKYHEYKASCKPLNYTYYVNNKYISRSIKQYIKNFLRLRFIIRRFEKIYKTLQINKLYNLK